MSPSADFDLVIGGAIEGFIGYVGNSLSSYGYSSDGGIYLECDLTLKEEPEEFAFHSNDVGMYKTNHFSGIVLNIHYNFII